MDLERGVFKKKSAEAIARSILSSVKKSRRRKGTLLSSGISMLSYYINRGGLAVSPTEKTKIQAAKAEYRQLAGRQRRGTPANRN